MKVLLIEDNPVDARLTQDLLDQWPGNQFAIQPVSTLSEALTHLSRERFDVVLLDLSLPDTHGLSTVTQVLTTGIGVPVVVLSGHDDHALALQAIQQGAQDYLVKGQGGTEFLARAILYAIERKRAQERLTYLAQYDQLTELVSAPCFATVSCMPWRAANAKINQSASCCWIWTGSRWSTTPVVMISGISC